MFNPSPTFLAISEGGLPVLAAVALGVSLLGCRLIVGAHRRWGIGGDCHLSNKPQGFHGRSVSRLGGVAILAGFGIAFFLSPVESMGLAGKILMCSLPVFLFGLAEDLTRQVKARLRLVAAMVSALLGVFWLGAVLHLPFEASWGGVHFVLSVGFTLFCVTGFQIIS